MARTVRNARVHAAVAAVVATLGVAGVASAASYTWNPNNDATPGSTAGSGTWSISTANWWDATASANIGWTNLATDDAFLTGPTPPAVPDNIGGTITLGSDITVGKITGDDRPYTIDLDGFNLTAREYTLTANVFGAGSLAFTNSSATQSTFTIGNDTTTGIFENSYASWAGNMAVVVKDTAWTPTGSHTFTGDLTFQGIAATVATVERSSSLGSASGQVNLNGNSQIRFKSHTDGLWERYTRDIDIASTASIGMNNANVAVLEGTVSGVLTINMANNQGMMVLAGDNDTGTKYLSGSITSSKNGFALVLAHDDALGRATDITFNTANAKTLGFMGDADGSTQIEDAIPVNLGQGAGPGLGHGHIHNFGGTNSFGGSILHNTNVPIVIGAEPNSSLTLSGAITSRGLVKVGAGTIVLAAGNAVHATSGLFANEATVVQAGTLSLDFSQAGAVDSNIINYGLASSGAPLQLAGGTLEVKGSSEETNSQTFLDYNSTTVDAGFTVKQGDSKVRVIQNGASTVNLNLGRLQAAQRLAGGTVEFTRPTSGNIILPKGTSGTLGIGVDNAILANAGAAFATVVNKDATSGDVNATAGNDWAATDALAGGNRNIVAGSSISGFYTANTDTTLSGNADMSGGLDTAISGDTSISSLRFHKNSDGSGSAGARTITIGDTNTLTTGGILVTSSVGTNASTITGGKITGAASQDLVVFQNNTSAPLTISSQIVNNTATGLTKSGDGTLVLDADNRTASGGYTGKTYLNAGMLKLANANALGEGNLSFKGGVLGLTSDFSRAIGTGNNQVSFLGAGGFAAYGADRTVDLGATMTWHTNFIKTGEVLTLGATDATGTVILSRTLSLPGDPVTLQRTINVPNSTAAGMANLVEARLAGRVTGSSGIDKIGGGTLEMSYYDAAQTGNNRFNDLTGNINVMEGTLLLTGRTGNSSATTPVTVYDDANFVVSASGVHAGTVDVRAGGTATINGTVAKYVSVSGVLGGSGTITGAVSILSGGTISPGNSVEPLNVGSLALSTGSISLFEIDSDSSFDTITSTGAIEFGGELQLVFSPAAIAALQTGQKEFDLYGFGSSTGDFSSITGNLPGGVYSFNSGTGVLSAVVPEPGVIGVLGGVSLLALCRRQRRA